jgi:hypothetical protein
VGPEAESSVLYDVINDFADKRNARKKGSVSSWKEKNVTLKEKHLHAKNKLYFSYVSLNFHNKIIHIKCDYLRKRRNLFNFFFF